MGDGEDLRKGQLRIVSPTENALLALPNATGGHAMRETAHLFPHEVKPSIQAHHQIAHAEYRSPPRSGRQ